MAELGEGAASWLACPARRQWRSGATGELEGRSPDTCWREHALVCTTLARGVAAQAAQHKRTRIRQCTSATQCASAASQHWKHPHISISFGRATCRPLRLFTIALRASGGACASAISIAIATTSRWRGTILITIRIATSIDANAGQTRWRAPSRAAPGRDPDLRLAIYRLAQVRPNHRPMASW